VDIHVIKGHIFQTWKVLESGLGHGELPVAVLGPGHASSSCVAFPPSFPGY